MGWNFRVVNLLSLPPQTKKTSISRASKHLIQSKIQTKRHRSRGGEKASRESQRSFSTRTWFVVVPVWQIEDSPHKRKQQKQ